MGHNFVTGGPEGQAFLVPPDVRDWLPAGHLAWGVLEVARELDVSGFAARYRADGQGRPAYHPRLMVALIGYCYCKGIRSSRAVEAATFDDVGARVICGNLHPDHATVARFIDRHEEQVRGLLAQSVAACARQGLVRVDVVAGDGTKVKASASKARNRTAEQLDAEIAGLEAVLDAEVGCWIAQARAEDAAGDDEAAAREADAGSGPAGPGGPAPGRKRTAQTLARRRRARDRLAADEAARAGVAEAARQEKITRLRAAAARQAATADQMEARAAARVADYQRRAAAKAAAGSRRAPDGRAPVPADGLALVRAARQIAGRTRQELAGAITAPAPAPVPGRPPKASATDPSSRVMPSKHGGFAQNYNVQVIASRRQVILSIGTHDNPVDTGALHPALAAARATLDAAGITGPIGKALFDAGYASEDNFTTACEPELFVAVTRESRQTGRLRDRPPRPSAKPGWQAMTARLATPEGAALYKQRSAIIEPVFAQLFARLGRDLNYRDTQVSTELHLWAATHNILKLIRDRNRNAGQATRPAPAT